MLAVDLNWFQGYNSSSKSDLKNLCLCYKLSSSKSIQIHSNEKLVYIDKSSFR